MRRVLLCFCLFFLCSCQSASYVPQQNFESKILTIYISNESYAQALQTLWQETYPEYKEAIQFSKNMNSDVQFMKDQDVWDHKEKALKFTELELENEVPKRLTNEVLKDVFLPIHGEGLIFVYNEHIAKKLHMDSNQLQRFEDIAKYGSNLYYHNHKLNYIYPFLFDHDQQLTEFTLDTMLPQKQIEDSLEGYTKIYDALNLSDNMIEQDAFYQTYLSGLFDIRTLKDDQDVYKDGLHFTQMPSWDGETPHPLLTTYGFVVRKDTASPNIARAFLEMVRSTKGIQAYLDNDQGFPIIDSEDIDNFYIYSRSKKEIAIAMNESQLYDFRSTENKHIVTLLEQSNMTSIIQNYIKRKGDVKDTYQLIVEDVANTIEE